MRVPRIAVIALLGAAAVGTSATAASAHTGRIEPSPHAVRQGGVVALSTESCRHCSPAKVFVNVDGKHYKVWLDEHTSEGMTGWFHVPWDTDPGRYEVEGRCAHGPKLEGSFWVKKGHHEQHHHHHHDH